MGQIKASLNFSQAQSHVAMVKAQIYVGFVLDSLSKEAQAVTSRNDSLAILECTQFDQTAINHLEMIRRFKGLRLKDWRARQEGLESSPNSYK
ncbi:hypothetical protein Tco_0942518 [Tanacetum coccineum]